MTIYLNEDHPQAIHHGMAGAGEDEQKPGLRLDLQIDDPESISTLAANLEGRERISREGCPRDNGAVRPSSSDRCHLLLLFLLFPKQMSDNENW